MDALNSEEILKQAVTEKSPSFSRAANRFGKRHILMILGMVGFANLYALRVNLSVALVAMVNSTHANEGSGSKNEECRLESSSSTQNNEGRFDWDEHTQGIILGSFFYGYILTQLPSGWIAGKYGAKRVLGIGVLCTSVLTLLTPLAAKTSVYALITVRILEGLGEGVAFPAMHAMWSYWAPPLERSRLVAGTYAGSQIGTILSYPISGWLCAWGFDGGWPSAFYFFGFVGLVWVCFWMYFVHDTPREHPTISKEELEYIEVAVGKEQDHLAPKNKGYETPWKSMMTSICVWAIIAANFTCEWGFYTLLTTMPTYFKEILGVNIRENGLLSAIPFICNFVSTIVCGYFSDYLRHRNWCSTEVVRKITSTSGLILAAGCLIGASFVKCHQTALAVFFLSLALMGDGFAQTGFTINMLDVGARYAGVLMAISNTIATISGFASPYVVGLLTNNKPTRHQWQIVFYIAASVYLFGSFFYLFFASGSEQTWNRPPVCYSKVTNMDEEESYENPNFKQIAGDSSAPSVK